MATTYCLGVFNDNFFKQAAMLLAVSTGLSQLQGYATVLFALPFILFSASAGWCADRFPKKTVLITVKGLELIALSVGGIGLITESWPLILAMVFVMGLQSTFFSPALNGSIPELYPDKRIPGVNAILKLATTLAILLGVILAGICLDIKAIKILAWLDASDNSQGIGLVVIVIIATGVTGFLASFALARRPASKGSQRFPWIGPLHSIRDCFLLSTDRHLMLGFLCEAWFYFLSVLTIQIINTMGIKELHLGTSKTSFLIMALMLGVCLGSFIAVKITKVKTWQRYIPPSVVGMGLFLAATGLTEVLPPIWHFPYLLTALAATGCAGGIFIIPTATILQTQPQKNEKGRALSVANFCSFTAIFLAGLLFSIIDGYFLPTRTMLFLGGSTILMALFFKALIQRHLTIKK